MKYLILTALGAYHPNYDRISDALNKASEYRNTPGPSGVFEFLHEEAAWLLSQKPECYTNSQEMLEIAPLLSAGWYILALMYGTHYCGVPVKYRAELNLAQAYNAAGQLNISMP